DKAFQKVKRDFQQKIRKKPAERIAALKPLEDFPNGDAADLVYVTLLDDKSDDVRTAAVDFLMRWRDREGVAARILQRMTSNTRKDPMDLRAMGGLRVLAGTEDDDLQRQVLAYLDEFLGTPQANQYLLHEMIDEQSPVGDTEEVLRMLALFTRVQFFDRHFGYRRCVMQGMMQVKGRDAIGHLINELRKLKGLVQLEGVTDMSKTTGQNLADDAAKWKAWWAQNQGAKDLPEKPKIPPPTNYGKFGEYYGIPICAKRIVFVLDTSGSMRSGRLDAAKVELIRAIKELPKEFCFSISALQSTGRVGQRGPVRANKPIKQTALKVGLKKEARNDTATFDALEAAFDLEPEAIYLLSDGAPQGGE